MAETTPRTRIARSLTELQGKHQSEVIYDVVIVGSGYGGSVAAQQLAGTTDGKTGRPLKVCLLERGREFLPGDFPSTFGELPRELRVGRQTTGEVSRHEGLFDVRLGEDVNALVANGLGGGSLINAGVMLEPRADDFKDPQGIDAPLRMHWTRLLNDLRQGHHFRTARRLLGAEVWREGQWIDNTVDRLRDLPLKTQALQSLTPQGGPQHTTLPPITVALEDADNAAGTPLKACNQCGDCMTGCNVGAKDSLDTNLLRAAHRGQVEIYTGATVTSVKRDDSGSDHQRCWSLRIVHTDALLQARQNGPFRLRAHRVILAAGALGSPEILLRSRDDTLAFSTRLGSGFSCNGDNIAAVRGMAASVNGSADEDLPLDARCVGPTITAAALLKGCKRPFLLQEFSVPGPMKRIFDEIVTTASTLATLPEGDYKPHSGDDDDPLAVDPEAMDRTLLVGMIGHDEARGSLHLAQPMRPIGSVPQMGALRIDWPDARAGCELDGAHEATRTLVEGAERNNGRKLVANPMWRLLPPGLDTLVSQPRGPVLTVHPLGGCGIAFNREGKTSPDAEGGVVDEFGAVLDASTASDRDAWQDSLVVLDGSIVPLSLGVNPALTITALALRAMAHWRTHWKIEADVSTLAGREPFSTSTMPLPKLSVTCKKQTRPALRRTEVEVIERLWGAVPLAEFDGGAVVELTLAYEPTAVERLIGKARATVEVNADRSRLRIYNQNEWDRNYLKAANDVQRKPYIRFEMHVGGRLRFLHREATGPVGRVLSALWAWVRNRGLRDIFGKGGMFSRTGGTPPAGTACGCEAPAPSPHACMVRDLRRLASRAGEVRLFDYQLMTGTVLIRHAAYERQLPTGEAPAIVGDKRLTYNRRANPWMQLTRLRLTAFPGLPAGQQSVLVLDARFLANQGVPLLHVTHQRNHAEALAELLSFGLYMARVLISTHLWTFRKPDAPAVREPLRLPGRIAGLPDPEVTELVVDRWPDDSPHPGQPLSIRLTRYPKPGHPPMLMIHGYSVSGNTFTHPSLEPSAAGYFWQQGRDVWVVELRTSTALASATYPWAMEQPGLIDIPAALMHVHIATGRKVDVFAHCIGCAMFSMALLSDARDVRSSRVELGVDTWLTSEHFGILNAFNGAHAGSEAHPVVNSVVLSQKGPVLRYTDANILRAFILQYVRRWLLSGDYQFRPSAEPKVAEQLLDRLLASLPYPDDDYDVENPLRFWVDTPWTGTRHRMDALYGRDFNAENMSRETLEAIDDLFGPINLDTVSQTIHFARFNGITNQRGRGEFVTRKRLKDRWSGVPTLALHGQDNGLVDVHTQLLLQRLLQDAAGVPLVTRTFPAMGHQDVLIGKRRLEVFAEVQAFLKMTPGVVHSGRRRKSAQAEAWIGPRIDPPHNAHGTVRVACMSRPDQGDATLCLLPAIRTMRESKPHYQLLADNECPEVCGDFGPSGRWLFARPVLTALDGVKAEHDANLGWLAVLVYALDETTARWSPFFENPQHRPAAPADGTRPAPRRLNERKADIDHVELPYNEFGHHNFKLLRLSGLFDDKALLSAASKPIEPLPLRLSADVRSEVRAWLMDQQPSVLERCFVRLPDLRRAQRLATATASEEPLCFMVGSCQYPSGIVDETVASSSLRRLTESLDRINLALMLGDQVYADATAGLVDPVRRDELYDQPHDRALRLPAMRHLLRRVPVQMLLDDHELFDNWEPLPREAHGSQAVAARRKIEQARTNGGHAYLRYQRMCADGVPQGKGRTFDFSFKWSGRAFYMLDTRTGRSREEPASWPGLWSNVRECQRASLEAWLQAHRDEVKFVSTPSLLLPRQRETAVSEHNAARSDAWDGFPGSMRWLLNFLVKEKIRNTVFLSGDEHHSMLSEVWLGPECLKIVSVHSSALYAPFPFANGRARELVADEVIPAAVYGVHCEVKTWFPPPGDGYAVLEVDDKLSPPVLRLQFNRAGDDSKSVTVALS